MTLYSVVFYSPVSADRYSSVVSSPQIYLSLCLSVCLFLWLYRGSNNHLLTLSVSNYLSAIVLSFAFVQTGICFFSHFFPFFVLAYISQ